MSNSMIFAISVTVIGFVLAFVLFLLGDNWNIIHRIVCRFCAVWWFALGLNVVMPIMLLGFSFEAIVITIVGAMVSVGICAIVYQYIRTSFQ